MESYSYTAELPRDRALRASVWRQGPARRQERLQTFVAMLKQ